jgi:cullin 3
MVILMLFNNVNDGDSLSFKDIENATSIAPHELKRHLQSLACAKFKILLKEPKSREVAETDQFMFNVGFQSNLARIKIMTVAAAKVENKEERKDTMEKVEETRKHQTEAAIVRIMKYALFSIILTRQRKSLDHNNLIAEVTGQLSSRFAPAPAMIKARIEALIDREYLERDASNMKVYKYLV